MKKIIIITLMLLIGLSYVNAQTPQYAPLKIGEKVPDIEFVLKNYHSPTARISDFKGKVLIFDFWSTFCPPCIANMPRMQGLQEHFGDKIQIILINVKQNEKEVMTRLAKSTISHNLIFTMPSIIGNEALAQLFPHQYAGNYVWIDKEGILRLSAGSSYNNHIDKINEVLEGRDITYAKSLKGYDNKEKSLSQLVYHASENKTEMGTLFTAFNDGYPLGGGVTINLIDSVSNTIRNTYVNQSILALYYHAQEDVLRSRWKSRVYGPNIGTSQFLDPFLLFVNDTIRFDWRFLPQIDRTDINMAESKYCYEQILPKNMSKEEASTLMREDLDRFLKSKFGVIVSNEEANVPCYFIRRTNDVLLTEKAIRNKLKHLGKREFRVMSDFNSVINAFYHEVSHKGASSGIPYVFDIYGIDGQINTFMPVWKKGDKLDDFILALNANGLDFIKGEQLIDKIVLKDHQ